MAWETVQRFMARSEASEPRVRLNRGTELVITAAALRLIGGPTHVRLLVDRERRLFALAPASGDDPEAFRLCREHGAASSRRFSTVALTRTFGLDTRRQAFTPVYDEAAGHLVCGRYAVAGEAATPPVSAVREMVAQANGQRDRAVR